MYVFVVRTPDGSRPDIFSVYTRCPANLSTGQKVYERQLIGYEPQVEPCPEITAEPLDELLELSPQPQVSVVIDVGGIEVSGATRDKAIEFVVAVLAAARS